MAVVYPVPGHSLNFVPQVPLDVNAETAARLIRTGAFASKSEGGWAGVEPEKYVADERLDFYDNPRKDDHDEVVHKHQGPALAGPSDSTPEE